MDRFSALPDEILDLISQEIQEHKNLFSLCLVSKNCYDVFNRRLYESVDSLHDQIPTLTLSENERMPLKGPHPASFVETLTLKFNREDLDSEEMEQEVIRENLFRRQAILALNNVAKYAGLRRLELGFPKMPLHEVLKGWNSTAFSNLRELFIRCPIMERRSLDIFVLLCCSSPSLTSLELDWWGFEYISDPEDINSIARFMEMVPKACPNLRELHLRLLNDIIGQQSFRERIQQVLDDPSFTFPLLQKFFCIYFMNCNTFLVRHPGIEKLECLASSELGFLGLLPNLRYFSGYVSDYLALCTKCRAPVESLEVDLSRFNAEEEEISFISGLINAKMLRKLVLPDCWPTAITLAFLGSMTKACPKLTHFACTLWEEESIHLIYSTILHNLADLEHLKLKLTCTSEPNPDIFSDSKVISDHRSLKTAENDILITGNASWTRKSICFVKKKDEVLLVPKLDSNGFDQDFRYI